MIDEYLHKIRPQLKILIHKLKESYNIWNIQLAVKIKLRSSNNTDLEPKFEKFKNCNYYFQCN